jgi:hypothetical protein
MTEGRDIGSNIKKYQSDNILQKSTGEFVHLSFAIDYERMTGKWFTR